MNLTIIIPAYNESHAIVAVLQQIKTVFADHTPEILVIDDGSSDDTARISAEVPGVRVIQHQRNLGYGASLKTGIRAATTEYILTMDADGQHRAQDALKLYQSGTAYDMVVGQRTELVHSVLWRMPGKWLLGTMANYLAKQKIPDLNSGMRLIRSKVVKRYMHLCPSGFSFSTTITLVLLTRGYSVCYVPINVQKRLGKSTVSISAGFQTLILLFRIAALFDPLRVFVPFSVGLTMFSILWTIPYILLGHGVSTGSMLGIVTGILLFALGILCDQISQLRLERYEVQD